MNKLHKRSYQKELLDNPFIPFADIKQNMMELNTINRYLGGHAITIAGIKKLLTNYPHGKPVTICEIGCGGGDNLNAIARWCNRIKINAVFVGIDLKKECIEFARLQYPLLKATWIAGNYSDINFGSNKPHIIFSSLFCHHFTEVELVPQLLWMQQNTTTGFFINDLHRNLLAYTSIKAIARLFSKSYLLKNDAPLSVARGFTKKEWQYIFKTAGFAPYSIKWKWAFRYLIIYQHE